MYLAAAGVGRLGIVDFDVVDESNLQRQIIHGQSTVGTSKMESARRRIADINPHVHVVGYEFALNSANALEIFSQYDVIVDGTDNFQTRYLVNDACVLTGKPNVYGSIFRFEGQASVFWAQHGPCYRCLYPEPPPPGLVLDPRSSRPELLERGLTLFRAAPQVTPKGLEPPSRRPPWLARGLA
jgi:adenylyltransferase/sulfurtransferase